LHFIITEVYKLVGYFHDDYRLHYLKTKDDVEVDLVIDRPGQPLLFIEIKSSKNVRAEDLSKFIKITKEFGDCEAICLSRDECKKKIHNVMVYPWQEGLKALV
jgi:predicted AAA+ superfamily ATPase